MYKCTSWAKYCASIVANFPTLSTLYYNVLQSQPLKYPNDPIAINKNFKLSTVMLINENFTIKPSLTKLKNSTDLAKMWQGVSLVQPSSSILMTVPEFPIPEPQSHRNLKPNLCLHLAGKETHNPKATSTYTAAACLDCFSWCLLRGPAPQFHTSNSFNDYSWLVTFTPHPPCHHST